MIVSAAFPARLPVRTRAAVMAELAELRRLLPGPNGLHHNWHESPLSFGLAALDSHLPESGLACGALHEIVPATQAALPAAFGFLLTILARRFFHSAAAAFGKSEAGGTTFSSFPPSQRSRKPVLFIVPAYGRSRCGYLPGRISGHGLNSLGLDPSRAVLVETAHRKETLWALVEALRSGTPCAVAGAIDQLDLKTSQKLHLAAADAGRPLLLLRPSQTLESSAAATRWRIGTAPAARDRFGLYARPRWRLQLERCRNGRPGEWVVEYDHVTHRFSLVAALADHSLSCGAGAQSRKQAVRS
jgi:protein ImuA